MPRRPIVLFATSPEHGDSNVHMAVISSLLEKHGDEIEIHLTSQSTLRDRSPPTVTFHPLPWKSIVDNWPDKFDPSRPHLNSMEFVFSPAGFLGSMWGCTKLQRFIHAESPEEYIETAQSAVHLFNTLKPDLVVVGFLAEAVVDAAIKTGQNYIRLSPNTLREVAAGAQGLRAFLWPCAGTGYPFPIPWYLIPLNIINLLFVPIWLFIFDSNFRAKNKARNAAGFSGPMPIFQKSHAPTICMSTPSIDYPAIIPQNVFPCGPIIQASRPLEQVDRDLYDWVMSRPTILICFGSHYPLDEGYGHEVFNAIRLLLDTRKDVQVLWKLRKWTSYDIYTDPVGDRLRVTDWLTANPSAIMATGNVICVVNHGGSNSYHEALFTGIPQVIVSSWYDCHDFAVRAEWLGIGKWGNRAASPRASYRELYKAVLEVIGLTANATYALQILDRAMDISEVAQGRRSAVVTKHGPIVGALDGRKREGRDVAAEVIMEYLAVRK
ncbi:hypothetical protein BCR39DRAFT_557870 [Naematelia encephala]|uniref:UDP-glucoronosyl and UDP-glucosyl transferase family protein n=1 Tax=Naematelia encephala TaxID=71784 RepID=A0A1Y2BBM2_9TREE|nr:hypothetical protein BCR39DRAFT_557870 [Naematelia encephala]